MTRLEEIKARVEAAAEKKYTAHSSYSAPSADLPPKEPVYMQIAVLSSEIHLLKHAREDIPWLLAKLDIATRALEHIKNHPTNEMFEQSTESRVAQQALREIRSEREKIEPV